LFPGFPVLAQVGQLANGWGASREGLTIKITRLDVDGFTLCKDLANFVEFPGVPSYEYYDPK